MGSQIHKSSHLKLQAESRESKQEMSQGFKLSNPVSIDILFSNKNEPASSLSNNTTNWGLSVQISDIVLFKAPHVIHIKDSTYIYMVLGDAEHFFLYLLFIYISSVVFTPISVSFKGQKLLVYAV